MMLSKGEYMDNNKRLETIMKIRESREILDSMDLTNSEKEVLRRSLNFYEQKLDNEIASANNNIVELEEMDIKSNNQKIVVPKEKIDSKYKEYANIQQINITDTINSLLNQLRDTTMLASLKEYALSLQQLNNVRENNQEEFKEYLGK